MTMGWRSMVIWGFEWWGCEQYEKVDEPVINVEVGYRRRGRLGYGSRSYTYVLTPKAASAAIRFAQSFARSFLYNGSMGIH